jgi:parallel beta-helix repeat protein
MRPFRKLLAGRSAQNVVEYAMLLGMVFGSAVLGLTALGGTLADKTDDLFTQEQIQEMEAAQEPGAEEDDPDGNVYYVDSDDGSDANPATREAPWRTVARVNAEALRPGDTVRFKRGCRWREVLSLNESGSAGSPITFESYGDGARPLLMGSRASDEDGCTWRASSGGANEYYLVRGGGSPGYRIPCDGNDKPGWLWYKSGPTRLDKGTVGALADGEWGWGDGDGLGFETIYVRNDAGTPGPIEVPQATDGVVQVVNRDYLVFRDLSVRFGDSIGGMLVCDGSDHILIEGCEFSFNNGAGLGIHGDELDAYILVRDCLAQENAGHGIDVDGREGPPVRKIRHVTVEDCEAWGTFPTLGTRDGYGVKFTFADQGAVLRCHTYENFGPGINLDGNRGAPLDVIGGCDENEIAYNVVHDNGSWGIALEISSRNHLHHNIIHDNGLRGSWKGGGITCEWYSQENRIHNNVIYGTHNSPAIGASGHSIGTEILNNTVLAAHYGIAVSQQSEPGTRIINNIVSSPSYHCWLDTEQGVTSDHNNWFGTGRKFIVRSYDWPPNPFGLSAWRTLSGQDGRSFSSDPQFLDAGADDYQLSDTSPCVDAGTDVGLPYEGEAPDMGALETDGTSPPASGPQVTGHSPSGVVTNLTEVTVGFDRAIDESTFSAGDLALQGPSGSARTFSVSSISGLGGNSYAIGVVCDGYEGVVRTEGAYRLVVGPEITDGEALPMDQDGDGENGEPVQDTYEATFSVWPYDLDPNGRVDFGDVALVAGDLGAAPGGADWHAGRADLDGSGVVDDGDSLLLEARWGSELPVGEMLAAPSADGAVEVVLCVVEEPTATQTVSSPPASATCLPAGGTVWAEVWVKDAFASPAGITGGSLDLDYGTDCLTADAAGPEHGEALPLLRGGAVDAGAGLVDELRAATLEPGVGVGQYVLFGRVCFETAESGVAQLSLEPGDACFALRGVGNVAWSQVNLEPAGGLEVPIEELVLSVCSTPVSGVNIGGSPSGVCGYTTALAPGSAVSLMAPATFDDGAGDYEFVRWTLDGEAEPDGRTTLNFTLDASATAVAVYREISPATCTLAVRGTRQGARVNVNGTPHRTHHEMELAEGTEVEMTAARKVKRDGRTYFFVRWKGHARGQRTIRFTLNEDTVKAARYKRKGRLRQRQLLSWLRRLWRS